MRKKIVAGNWKMNVLRAEAIALVNELENNSNDLSGVQLIVFPPAVHLNELNNLKHKLAVGAQNFYPAATGAFTGEIGLSHVLDSGASHVLIGHSERRMHFNEDNSFVKEKVNKALESNLSIVFCCGEALEIRDAGRELEFVKNQLTEGLFHLEAAQMSKISIAYEPIWAIGTGRTASVQQAEDMHKSIRSWVLEKYSEEIAAEISILYGGSCNPSNAKELFACANVDGGLIGGASLVAESFLAIANSY